jgi:hypothetical protein
LCDIPPKFLRKYFGFTFSLEEGTELFLVMTWRTRKVQTFEQAAEWLEERCGVKKKETQTHKNLLLSF